MTAGELVNLPDRVARLERCLTQTIGLVLGVLPSGQVPADPADLNQSLVGILRELGEGDPRPPVA